MYQSSITGVRRLLAVLGPAISERSKYCYISSLRQSITSMSTTTENPPTDEPIKGVSDTHKSTLFSSVTSFQSSMNTRNPDNLIQSAVTEVNSNQIHYETTGHGNHVILLLPGALGSTQTDFGPQLENLNKDLFRLVAWDPPGYGKNYPPERIWREKFLHHDAHLAAGLMQNLGIKSYSLLGWSDGGITAMILAANYSKQVRKLVIWGSNAYITEEEAEMYQSIKDIDNWSERMRKPFIQLYGEEYFRSAWAGWVDNFVSRYFKECNGDICKGDLSKIECPTLIVHGQKDPMVPKFHADHLHSNIKNARLENWPEGKHNLHLRFHREFNSLVEQFLVEI